MRRSRASRIRCADRADLHRAGDERFNVDTANVAGLDESSFGALVEVTNHVPIVVERSMYWDAHGVPFSGGTNATGTRLP
jgi:hypothetical protein